MDVWRIYIPLCFYYIVYPPIYLKENDWFTFHYVSITSPDGRLEAWIPEQIYIPLCFYYISRHARIFAYYTEIYIPLCFYYIKNWGHYIRKWCSNLHSTMFLLHLENIILRVIEAGIDLHSTMFLLHPCKAISRMFTIWIFTFHYVSITSIQLSQIATDILGFTFHYVSITSSGANGIYNCVNSIYIPLCFYYIPDGRLEAWIPEQIYIPLCFYYISPTLKMSLHFRQHLHSTMFLLHRLSRASTFESIYYLHSTMFLLHPRTSGGTGWERRKIYIPLCFYYIIG